MHYEVSTFSEHLPLGVCANEAGRWLRGVATWQYTPGTGLFELGSVDRGLLIGPVPPRNGEDELPFSGRDGTRVRELLHCATEEEFRDKWDTMYLIPRWPGLSGRRERWPARLAQVLASRIVFCAKVALVCGCAAEVFNLTPYFNEYPLSVLSGRPVPGFAIPHPSGVNRYWNSEENKRKAAEFFAYVEGRF